MFHATETLHRYEARAASGATYEIVGASFEDAALEFADLVHEGEVELTDCETGVRRSFKIDLD
ncbi:MAG: hypothetical protein C0481_11630 [Phenylobacterium sp.]|uniref:DUF5961 family protein n=1 Tax=Phenylobacterium sp. TaxID=1871053 RepID=UPI0025E16985|nr:DUF5961 family protein [Phenylobacterium sp.]MBA4012508.1 hypothetical protein [Phenylobacterium sp.]